MMKYSIFALLFAITPANSNELPPAPDGTFSIVVIPDTQRYLGREPDDSEPLTNPVFDAWTNWIVEKLEDQNIAFVSHVGDIVDNNVADQWELAGQLMDRLHGKVPENISQEPL